MKIIEKNLKQDYIKVVPESQDDLWHLYNIIYKVDEVYAYTSRAIKTDTEYQEIAEKDTNAEFHSASFSE